MDFITEAAIKAVKHLYQTDITPDAIALQETRKEFEGQVTIVTFPFTKFSRKSPEQTGTEVGEYLLGNLSELEVERLDQLSITDDGFARALRNAETDLVDAYAAGGLEESDRQRFRDYYLSSPRRRARPWPPAQP